MEFIISSVSSIIASTIIYPVEVIKVQYQRTRIIQPDTSVYQLTKNLYNQKSIKQYYRGLTSHLMTYPLFWGIFFQMDKYNYINNKLLKTYINANIASSITNPLFVLKVRFQLESINNKSYSYKKLVMNIYRQEGILAFFKGYPSSVFNNIKLAIQFPLYDEINKYTSNVALSAIISKSIASSMFYPFSIVRTNQRDSIKKLSICDVLKLLYKRHGFKGYFKGVGMYNLVTLPNFVIMMVIRDYANSQSSC